MRPLRLIPITVAAALATLVVAPVECQLRRDTIDVLYVGNSYVYFNNLPGLVEGISAGLDGPVVRGTAHTHGGATLRMHLDDDHLPAVLSQGPIPGDDWDWVVVQEQSTLGTRYNPDSGQLGSAEAFHTATRQLVGMIRAHGAKPALYMTWAKEAFPSQSEMLSGAYRAIGRELDLPVAAVGEAWAEALLMRPQLDLYISDGSHPGASGSYLAACVIYATVTGRSLLGAPHEITGVPWNVAGLLGSPEPTVLVSLAPADAEFLQRIALKVVGADRISGG